MDAKLSIPPPDSEVPTLAPSRASASDDGKASATGGEQTDVEIGLTTADLASPSEKQQPPKEKQDDLARQATATSKTGKALELTATREDGSEYPKGLTLALIVLALCLSVFTMALGKPHRASRSLPRPPALHPSLDPPLILPKQP